MSDHIRRRAETLTERRMDRPRLDETEDDEAWDLEFAQALADVADGDADDHRERMLERRRAEFT